MNRSFQGAAALLAAVTLIPVARAADADGCGDLEHEDGAQIREAARQRVEWRAEKQGGATRKVRLLGINDFHGQLSTRSVAGRPAGGAAVLVSYLREAAREAGGDALIVYAGDHVGASPPNSALLQDEPAISVLNLLANDHCRFGGKSNQHCNVVGTAGNHEFDEGIAELQRLLGGGNHATGPFLEDPWRGARFPFVSANVLWADTGKTVFPPYAIAKVGEERIAVIGAVLQQTPTIVTPTGVAGLKFVDEADAINAVVPEIRAQGIRTMVVIIHQGGTEPSYTGATRPGSTISGVEINGIVSRLDSEIDVVISGHTHAFSNAILKNQQGKDILVVQAFSASTAFDQVDLEVDARTHDVTAASASVITTFGDTGPGLTPAHDAQAIVAAADARVAPLVNRVVGSAPAAITRTESPAGESALGNLIADAQRKVAGSELAMMNPGGIRADIPAGTVTWGVLFTVQPFANSLVTMTLTGAQVRAALEQQWLGQTSPRILKTSGFTYTWDAAAPVGQRIVSVQVGGQPVDPARNYRVTVNSFLAFGGDNFTTFSAGTERVGGAIDLDALVDYVQALPGQQIVARIEGRITRLH